MTIYYSVPGKNKIINGNFDIWQRATSQTSSGYGSDDRWKNENGGSTKTHSRQSFTLGQTDVPYNPKYFSRTVVTSSAGASNYVLKRQRIERVITLSGQTAILSFWAKADASKNIAFEFFQSFGTGGSPSASVSAIGVTTCALTTSWQKFTVIVNIPSISGKTLGSNDDDFLQLIFWFDAGSDYNSRTNSLGQQSGTFDIAQVQLEEGNVATPFEQRPIGAELLLCQRYFQICSTGFYGDVTSTSSYGAELFYITKRYVPTLTWNSDSALSGFNPDAFTFSDIKVNACMVRSTSTVTDDNRYWISNFNVDAEL